MKKEEEIKQRYERLAGELNERTRRLFAANEAMALGRGGIAVVARATGLSRQVITDGMQELREGKRAGEGRIRRIGGGRKSNVSKDASLSDDLERLVEPVTRGDPESPLRWTSKSVRKLAKELQGMGHQVSYELVSELLHGLGYSLQVSRKTREGGEHPDRDGQFEHLNAQAAAFLAAGEAAVSVDAKKKELVGDAQEPGAGMAPAGSSRERAGLRFPHEGPGSGHALWGVRPDTQRGLGERGH
jgi:transposase